MDEWYQNLPNAQTIIGTKRQEPVPQVGDIASGIADAVAPDVDASFAAGLANAIGQGVTFGFADEAIAGLATLGGYDYKEVRDAIRENLEQFRSDEPAYAYGFEIAASLLTPAGALKTATTLGLKGAAKLAAIKAAQAPTKTAALGGAVYGAGAAEEMADVPASVVAGGALGAGGQALAPVVQRGAKVLQSAGVPVTAGQLFGGGLKTFEESMTSAPLIGAGIKAAQAKAVEAFSPVALSKALKPIGVTIPAALKPRQAFNKAQRAINDEYDRVLSPVKVDVDDEFLTAIGGSIEQAKKLLGETYKRQGIDLERSVLDEIIDKTVDGKLSGKALAELQSRLGKLEAGAVKRNEFEVAEAYSMVDEALMNAFVKNAPTKRVELEKLNKAYSNFVPLRRAASMGVDSAITPARLLQSVRAEERKLGATGLGRLARGEGRMQRTAELGRAIGLETPDSGTAGRLATMLAAGTGIGALGGLATGQTELGTIAGLTGTAGLGMLGRGAYTRGGQELLKRLAIPAYSGALRSPATAGLLAQPTSPMAESGLGLLYDQMTVAP